MTKLTCTGKGRRCGLEDFLGPGLGYGIQWGMQLAALYVDTLFFARSDRGADIFNYAMQCSQIVAYVVVCMCLWRPRARSSLVDRFIGGAPILQMTMLLLGVGLVGVSSFVSSFEAMSAVAGILMGCGFAVGSLFWLYLFAGQEERCARYGLVVSWVTGPVVFVLLFAVEPLFRLMMMAGGTLVCSLLGIRFLSLRDSFVNGGDEGAGGLAAVAREKAAESWRDRTSARLPLFSCAVLALSFVFGISGPVLLEGVGVSSGDVETLAGHLSAIVFSVVFAATVISCFAPRISFLFFFWVAFTIDVSATVALPLLGAWYTGLYNIMVEIVYRCSDLLVVYACVVARGRTLFFRIVPFQQASSGLGLTLGIVLGNALYAQLTNGSTVLVIIALVILYAVFIVFSLAFVIRTWGASHGAVKRQLKGRGQRLAESSADSGVRDLFAEGMPVVTDAAHTWNDEPLGTAERLFGLSEREASVMAYLAKGRSVAFVAEKLGLSPNTVKSYAKTLYKKLGVHSRQELIDLADELVKRTKMPGVMGDERATGEDGVRRCFQ